MPLNVEVSSNRIVILFRQVFGAYATHPFHFSDHYYGTGETFLYTFDPLFKVRCTEDGPNTLLTPYACLCEMMLRLVQKLKGAFLNALLNTPMKGLKYTDAVVLAQLNKLQLCWCLDVSGCYVSLGF